MGIEFVGNTYVGRDISIDELFEKGYDAVFLGHGASKGSRLDVPGAELPGVILATEYLVRGNLPPEELPESMREPLPESRQSLVIGGGDTAMDCVRTAKRLGAKEVTCVYRRTEAEMPGRKDERVHAWEEDVRVEYLAAPLRFDAGPDGRVARAHFGRTELGEPDESGRRRPVPTGEEFEVEADTIVIAIGYRVDEDVVESAGLECEWDQVVVGEETGQTSRPGVYAGGDCVNGADLVVTALAGARRAVRSMRTFLAEKA
jgi:glutamate synthase (NADPH/NADH) small chain